MGGLSVGAQKISDILTKERIPFHIEYSFCDCKNRKTVYRFDFAIVTPHETILIEYDSEIHFIFTPYFHRNHITFEQRKGADRRKNDYCLRKGIRLYRIPYWEIGNIVSSKDILNKRFLVKDICHNDIIFRQLKGES